MRTTPSPTFLSFRALLAALMLSVLLLPSAELEAQPGDGYVGPELSVEPEGPGLQKGARGGVGYRGDWAFCADERERCSVRGWGVVRYGTAGRYYFREVRNASLQCDNTMFGDPYRGRSKRCEVRYYADGGWSGGRPDEAQQWTRCAREGQVCRVGGRALVRFGADGRHYEREVRGEVLCSVRSFGDPLPGRSKYCDVLQDAGWNGGGSAGQGGGEWLHCAGEDGYCNLPGRAVVRFGADGRYTERRYRGGSVYCSVAEFGDPYPRRKKSCEYRLEGGRPGGGIGGGLGGAHETAHFEFCANEDGYCNFRGRRLVRFGTQGRFVTREFRGGVECSVRAFGEDPYRGRKKHCEIEAR